jgi:predicted RNA-binding Zn-ribbon protein involved in translation (DUF1610 family)
VNYPRCDFSLSVRPIPEKCPQCGNAYLLYRERKSGNVFACDKAGCGFEKPAGPLPEILEVLPEIPAEPIEEPAPKPSTRGKPTAAGNAGRQAAGNKPRAKRAAKG